MQGILYESNSVLAFLFVTVLLGGGAAYATGQSCARTWRPPLVLFFYLLLLGVATRFVHFSVLGDTLLSVQYYLVDTIVLMVIGFAAFRHTRAQQMVTQYYWLNERAGPFSWRALPQPATNPR
ncbi:hypothetical protein GCM10011390_42210 [Aureimonas endophytica]|uniref:DUF6867 domain-containing protein n=1 Tax=Aureimonas endophytica TaxID=2027858 RepID=A0A916ZXZ7_9HYPH|nr:hypothetical protein [Aureimonas endophytica]GGE18603.1 hypothetical protein GCM10011390_42210 [Aureimonas endophytica]